MVMTQASAFDHLGIQIFLRPWPVATNKIIPHKLQLKSLEGKFDVDGVNVFVISSNNIIIVMMLD